MLPCCNNSKNERVSTDTCVRTSTDTYILLKLFTVFSDDLIEVCFLKKIRMYILIALTLVPNF